VAANRSTGVIGCLYIFGTFVLLILGELLLLVTMTSTEFLGGLLVPTKPIPEQVKFALYLVGFLGAAFWLFGAFRRSKFITTVSLLLVAVGVCMALYAASWSFNL
jgi:hypothetical protein